MKFFFSFRFAYFNISITVEEWQCEKIFMSFLIRVDPLRIIFSWAPFNFCMNFIASFFLSLDLNKKFTVFCISGSVGLEERIFFAFALVGDRRNVLIPALAIFSAPWIFTVLISFIISLIFVSFFLFEVDMIALVFRSIKNFAWKRD